MTNYSSYITEITLILCQKNLTRCEFVLKIIQIQQLFVKNDQVKTVNKLLHLIQRTNSDFKPN